MHPDKSSLSIRLTEPVVPLRGAPGRRASRHHEGVISPPAIIRGLLTLTLDKPTKISSIELELQAKATTHYTQGAGPSLTNVTEQYMVHSASVVVFKIDPVPQRATSTSPRVQFLDNHAGSDARYGYGTLLNEIGDGRWRTPSGVRPMTRSASLDPRLSRTTRPRLSFDHLETDGGRNALRDQSLDPASPHHGLPGQHSSNTDPYPSAASRSQSIASSSGIRGPRGPSIPESSQTPEFSCGSPPSVQSTHEYTPSRTSSVEELSHDNGEGLDVSAPHPESTAYYGLSHNASGFPDGSSEQDQRGRSHSRFSFGNVAHILGVMKDRVRSQSPRAISQPRSNEQERGRSLMKGKGKTEIHGIGHTIPQFSAADAFAADGTNDQGNKGWVVFAEGTYTYPIFFAIPNNSPPTLKADHGSLVWKVKAEVKRSGVFKSKMTAQKEVVVVCLPTADDPEGVEELDLQRQWDCQLQYRVQIAGQSFPIGGKVPFQLTIIPLVKIKVHSVLVHLDERTRYYTRSETQARSDTIRHATLLVIKHNNTDARHSEPILPLVSDEPDVLRRSPLYPSLRPGEDEREEASSFMGSGPWTIRHQLNVPDSCLILRPSNRTKGSNVMVDHILKIILRVEKEEDPQVTTRKKLYEIAIHIPIQILSCYCTSEWSLLPRYDEALRSDDASPEDTSTCPCRARRTEKARAPSHTSKLLVVPRQRITSPQTTNSSPSGGMDRHPSDSPASRTHLHELLMRGLMSEMGEAPPSYEPAYE